MKWKEQLRKEREEHWESEETVETEIDELEGGKEWKEGLDGTLAASAYSQEDYSSTRCHRLPARPQRSSLNGDTQHGHTYTSLWMFPRCILVSISPVSLSLSLFFQFYCPFLFIWLSFLQFSQLVPCLPFVTLYFYHSAYPSGSERGGHRQVAYAPSLGSLCEPFSILGHGQSSLAREKKIYRRRNNPNFYPHSLSPSFSHLTLFNQRESSVLLSVLLIFFFLFLSLPHIKATLPLDLTHCWLCKISVCLAETEVFPRCSWFWLFFSGDTLWNSVQNMKAAKNISHLLPAYLLSRQNKI